MLQRTGLAPDLSPRQIVIIAVAALIYQVLIVVAVTDYLIGVLE